MHYKGGTETGCHQYIVGYQNNKIIRSDLVYYHIKPLEDEYRNAARNYFIYGIWRHGSVDGDQREEWHELKDILAQVYPQIKYFPDLDRVMKAGHIHQSLKDWMVKWYAKVQPGSDYFNERPEYRADDYNELRAVFSYYMKYLHPEEKPEEMEL